MTTKILIIGVVKKKDMILLRKKPDGSPPYKEPWYLFGTEVDSLTKPEEAIVEVIKQQTGILVEPVERIGWDTEIKNDSDGTLTFYIYLDYLCKFISGKLKAAEGIEKLEWVEVSKLHTYELVPPSRRLFRKLGFL